MYACFSLTRRGLARLQTLSSHDSEVSALCYCEDDLVVITVGWDKKILVHDEGALEGDSLREIHNAHDADILCVAYSYELGLFATGCRRGVVKVWDYQLVTLEAELVYHDSSVMAIEFVPGHALMLTADAMGTVALWGVRPGFYRYAAAPSVPPGKWWL